MTGASREFVYEASSQIERLSDGFVELQREGFDRGTLDDLFRDAHTLKGNCSAEGFTEPAETAHALEDLLDGLRTRPEAFEESYVDVALEALDVLERQLMDLQRTGTVETDADRVVASIRDLVPDSAEPSDGASDQSRDGASDESVVTFDDIEVPSGEAGEDVSVEEALENAAVFDDLEELEGSVDATGFEDVEGVGLFDTDEDGTVDAGGLDESEGRASEQVDSTLAGDDDGHRDRDRQSAASGVESSTRRDSDVVPGEESYAEMVSDTSLADPDDLQSELEDVTFGEFDDDDDLSIGELVDLADDSPGVDRDRAGRTAEARGRDRESATRSGDAGDGPAGTTDGSISTTSGGEPDVDDAASDGDAAGVDGAVAADVFTLDDDGSSTDTAAEAPETDESIAEARDTDESTTGESTTGESTTSESTTTESATEDVTTEFASLGEDATEESASTADGAVDESASTAEGAIDEAGSAETEFEFGHTEGVDGGETDVGASGGATESDASAGPSAPDAAADPVVEPLDLDPGSDAATAASDPDPSNEPADTESTDVDEPADTESTDVDEPADTKSTGVDEGGVTEVGDGDDVVAQDDADGGAADSSVVDIVSRIERLEDGVSESASDDDALADADVQAADDSAASGGAGTVDDQLNDVLDVATEAAASPEDPETLPSEVPDVDRILADTEFDDVEDVEFATAEFYDRVGFETDSSTGAFVSEFGEAFEDDTTGFDSDAGRVTFDASSTIDPALLDANEAAEDDQPTSMETVREVTLDVEEADTLLELTEELVVDTQRLAGALEALPPAAADALASLRDVSTRIEDHVSNVRLVPLDAAFSGLPRTSRRVARTQDKEVAFLTENGDVEVDRRVVDELADPLVHLVRNAVDHGIEPPDERVANGKPSEGTVLVRAERTGETVTVAVEDDGRGADPDELRAAAVDAGLYTRAEANALSRAEALELMFHAGLSTTDEVSEVSGRGVGMDVVSDVVTRLEGTLDVQSEPGVGTTVELTLPVSVALSDVLTVAVGSQRFGLPATDVRRVEEYVPGRVDGDEYRLLTDDDDVERVPIVDLATALDVADESRSGPARTDVLVLTADPDPRALRCRDVVDWESVVLQPFDGALADHALARGAALTGDGSPVVVLEPAELGADQ